MRYGLEKEEKEEGENSSGTSKRKVGLVLLDDPTIWKCVTVHRRTDYI